MDYVDKLNIRDVLYLIHDLELRSSINNDALLDNATQLPTSHAVYTALHCEVSDLENLITAEHDFTVEQAGILDGRITSEVETLDEKIIDEHDFTVEELAKKTDLQLFLDFINNSLATVALSGSYNDLLDKPNSWEGGITVSGTSLVIDTSSRGLSPAEADELEAIIGSGEL